MKLQQLVVDTHNPSDHNENVVVARSNKIEPELVAAAVQWSTAWGGILSGQRSAIIYRQFDTGAGMLGRSYGTEFDDQGNRSLRTHWVIASPNQIKCYYNNSVLLVRTLSSDGGWFLQTARFESVLPELEIADCPINPFAYPSQQQDVQSALRAIDVHKQIAVFDTDRPLNFVGEVLQAYSFGERAKISFAINRRINSVTPFTINGYSQADTQLEQDLSQYDVYPLRVGVKLGQPS